MDDLKRVHIGGIGRAEQGDFDGIKAKARFLETIRLSGGTEAHVKNMIFYAQTVQYAEDRSIKAPVAYRVADDIIYFNPAHQDFENLDFDLARAHELSHRMDYLQYRSANNKGFTEAVERASGKVANVAHEVMPMLEVGGEYENDPALSDIISALSKGTLGVPVGHVAEYWNSDENMVRYEIFAWLSTLDVLARPCMKVIEKYFLELLNSYKEVVR